jgi:hypothetical protein
MQLCSFSVGSQFQEQCAGWICNACTYNVCIYMHEKKQPHYHGINHGRSGLKERIYYVTDTEKYLATNSGFK